jgi:hypothetical protein
MLNLELVRGDERLECDIFFWCYVTELARHCGWERRLPSPVQQSVVGHSLEVNDEDARSLAAGIRLCFRMLTASPRLSDRKTVDMLCRIAGIHRRRLSTGAVLEEPIRVADFCCKGGFRINLKYLTTVVP